MQTVKHFSTKTSIAEWSKRTLVIAFCHLLAACGGSSSSSGSNSVIESLAQSDFVACTAPAVSGISVRNGFDCDVFIENITRPTGLVIEPDGSVLITSSGGGTGSARVFRYFTDGSQIGMSDFIADPDGVALDSLGRVLVAGGSQVTIVNSLSGGMDSVCATLPEANLQNIASSPNGRTVVLEPDGTVSDIVCGEVPVGCATTGRGATQLAFGPQDQIFVSRAGDVLGVFEIDAGCAAVSQLALLDDARGIAFAPGGPFGSALYVADRGAATQRIAIVRPRESQSTDQGIDQLTNELIDFGRGFDAISSIGFAGTDTLYVNERSRVIRIFAR